MDTITLNIPKPKEIFVTLKASSFLYDAQSDAYKVKFNDSKLIANDTKRQSVIVLIPSCKVQVNSQTQQLKDEDIDTILDEIAAKERYKKKRKSHHHHHHTKNNNHNITNTNTNISASNATVTTTLTNISNVSNPSSSKSPEKKERDRDRKKAKNNESTSMPPPNLIDTKSQKEKLAAKLASIPKPRKQAKIDIEPHKPRPKSPVASARSGSRARDYSNVSRKDTADSQSLVISPKKSRRSMRKPQEKSIDKNVKKLPDLEETKLTSMYVCMYVYVIFLYNII